MKILIVEDDLLVADDLMDKLQRLDYRVTGVAVGFDEALELIRSEKPDLVLLDIELNGLKNGIDLAGELSAMNIPFIYLTGIQDMSTYLRARDTKPLKNLAKPIDLLNLRNTLLEAGGSSLVRQRPIPMIMDKNGNRQRIDLEHIVYIQAGRSYCDIYFEDGSKLTLTSSMKKVVEKLSFDQLIRISNSYHIHLKYIEGVRGNEVKMINNTYLSVTDSYKTAFNRHLNLL